MKITVVLFCVYLSLIQGLCSSVQHQENGAPGSGSRVLNGEDADPSDFPFLLILHKNAVVCGAAIVSNYFILTAAHCIFDLECPDMEIFSSSWEQGDNSTFRAAQCYPHEKFANSSGSYYDIALVRTSDDMLKYGEFKAIPLPEPGAVYPTGTKALVVGWGTTENGTNPGLLRGDVVTEDWDTCNYKYKHAVDICKSDEDCPVADIPKRVVCTQGQGSDPSGTCYGDSGGPLVVDNVLAGVVFGTISKSGVCQLGSPSLHTNVADFLPWIYSIAEPERETSRIPVTKEAA